MIPCQVRGPQVPGGPGGAGAGVMSPAQVSGPMPLQVTGAGTYLPAQNGDWSQMFNMMMPMIMMIMMLAIMMPMIKGFGKETA